jgi:hypothetical protein
VRSRTKVALAASIGLLAGCGNARAPVPSLTHAAAPDGFRTLRFPAAGVSFRAPRSWPVISQQAPLVTVVASGNAAIALWRYPRSEPPPASGARLAAARGSLLAAIRARQGAIQVLGSRLVRVGGAPAIQVNAIERIDGRPRRVLSTHVFAGGGEIVLEEYAPPALFRRLRRPVFAPVRRSLAIIPAAIG